MRTKEQEKARYLRRKDRVVAGANRRREKKRVTRTVLVNALKIDCGCSNCGTKEGELDFHHIDPTTKLFGVSRGLRKPITILQAEINKCVVLCKLCHAKETNQRGLRC